MFLDRLSKPGRVSNGKTRFAELVLGALEPIRLAGLRDAGCRLVESAGALEVLCGCLSHSPDLAPGRGRIRGRCRLEFSADAAEVGGQRLDRGIHLAQAPCDLLGQSADAGRAPLDVLCETRRLVRQADGGHRSLLPLLHRAPRLGVLRLRVGERLAQGPCRLRVRERPRRRACGADGVACARQAFERLLGHALRGVGAALDVGEVGLDGGEAGIELLRLLEPHAEVAWVQALRRAEKTGSLPPGEKLLPPGEVLVLDARPGFSRLVQVERENGHEGVVLERVLGQRGRQTSLCPVEAARESQRFGERLLLDRRRRSEGGRPAAGRPWTQRPQSAAAIEEEGDPGEHEQREAPGPRVQGGREQDERDVATDDVENDPSHSRVIGWASARISARRGSPRRPRAASDRLLSGSSPASSVKYREALCFVSHGLESRPHGRAGGLRWCALGSFFSH